jgi:hypothetical protein
MLITFLENRPFKNIINKCFFMNSYEQLPGKFHT